MEHRKAIRIRWRSSLGRDKDTSVLHKIGIAFSLDRITFNHANHLFVALRSAIASFFSSFAVIFLSVLIMNCSAVGLYKVGLIENAPDESKFSNLVVINKYSPNPTVENDTTKWAENLYAYLMKSHVFQASSRKPASNMKQEDLSSQHKAPSDYDVIEKIESTNKSMQKASPVLSIEGLNKTDTVKNTLTFAAIFITLLLSFTTLFNHNVSDCLSLYHQILLKRTESQTSCEELEVQLAIDIFNARLWSHPNFQSFFRTKVFLIEQLLEKENGKCIKRETASAIYYDFKQIEIGLYKMKASANYGNTVFSRSARERYLSYTGT